MQAPLLQTSGISKHFDGIFALQDATFHVNAGECIALVGENGAGKSTLMKILSGVWPAGSYDGELRFEGGVLSLRDTLDARRRGISIIHQELCLFPKLTVAENLFLTEEAPYTGAPSTKLLAKVCWKTMRERARNLLKDLGFNIPADALVEDLSVAERQLVEIARSFHHKAKLLILDEPTSALSTREVEHLFAVIRRMRERAMSFIYISHKLDEVFALADRIIVLRDGKTVATLDPKGVTAPDIIRHMVGRPLKERASNAERANTSQKAILEVSKLSHSTPEGKSLLHGIDFQLFPGEILGICGLMGSGRSELLRSLVGVLPGTRSGEVRLNGELVRWEGTQDALRSGVAFVPEDRKKDGLFLDLSVRFNASISILDRLCQRVGLLRLSEEKAVVSALIEQLGVKSASQELSIKSLSGGNQQKVLLGKVVATQPKILLLDEPTRGIDVGAKEEIYYILRKLVEEGISILMVSSELPEVLSLSHRVIVLRQGTQTGEFVNANLTQERLMECAAQGA